jgi:nitrite reductase/ring-hydroxylating ferredoxin subunit
LHPSTDPSNGFGERLPLSWGGELSVPAQVQAWYWLCPSADLAPGKVLSRDFLGQPIVLFRGQDGTPRALSAYCWHMGTHLGGGTVVGDGIRCPLHHWEFGGDGACRRIPGAANPPPHARQRSYPVAERYGSLFIFNGPAALFPPPLFSMTEESSLRVGFGKPVRMRCPWYAVAANAFDRKHLETVHERALREPPTTEHLDPFRFQLRYLSRVVGSAPADRTMRWLSRDHIRVTITNWGGSIVTIESDLGRAKSSLLVSLMPVEGGTEVSLLFGVPRTPLSAADALRLRVSGWLFTKFLQKDIEVLNGMRFTPRLPMPDDEPMGHFLQFLHHLPAADTAWEPVSVKVG